ncbi:metallophosphoesterase [Persicitalea jodogahamensis]|uniref:metallophosphoesterase n=1 Tax=Persicitalea jodogahamensis TaxID=402147 RepID=UPI0016748F47|nr:metallophosphoesterase [Persicitalea jodogahamensis]
MKYLKVILVLASALVFAACTANKPIVSLGLVADPQYADQPTAGKRYYRESVWKLKEAVDTFNHYKVDFVQTLGDVIDTKWESYDSILPVYRRLDPHIENYHSLGNHDFSIDSTHMPQLLDRLSMPAFYYSYTRKGWRFIVLDATDYAFFSNPFHNYPLDDVDGYYQSTQGQPNHYAWNSAIGRAQQEWLKSELALAESAGQKVILFAHMPLLPEEDSHNLWNGEEILTIIQQNPSVVAYINGHNHAGSYHFQDGVHYVTVFGMVDTEISSYAILNLYKNSIELKGFGNQRSFRLKM